MDVTSYLDRIIEKMSSSHDIVRDYPAYGKLPGEATEGISVGKKVAMDLELWTFSYVSSDIDL